MHKWRATVRRTAFGITDDVTITHMHPIAFVLDQNGGAVSTMRGLKKLPCMYSRMSQSEHKLSFDSYFTMIRVSRLDDNPMELQPPVIDV